VETEEARTVKIEFSSRIRKLEDKFEYTYIIRNIRDQDVHFLWTVFLEASVRKHEGALISRKPLGSKEEIVFKFISTEDPFIFWYPVWLYESDKSERHFAFREVSALVPSYR